MATHINTAGIETPEDILKAEAEERAQIVLKRNPESCRMTQRQRNLAIRLATNPTASFKENAVAAGYSDKANAATIKKQIQGKLGKTLADAGVHEIDIGQAIADGLRATRTIVYKETKRDGSGKITEETVTVLPVPDHAIRATYVKIACNLAGYFAPKKIEHSGEIKQKAMQIINIFDQMPRELLEQEVRRAKAEGVKVDFEILEED